MTETGGFYLSESNNLQVWYPKDTFIKGKYSANLWIDKKQDFELIHLDDGIMYVIIKALDFEFLGGL